jgi:hypothetical protein
MALFHNARDAGKVRLRASFRLAFCARPRRDNPRITRVLRPSPWSIGIFKWLSVMLDLAAFAGVRPGKFGMARAKEVAREWRNGRRAGFRCQYPKGCGGSNPPSRTHTKKEPRSLDRGSFRLIRRLTDRVIGLIRRGPGPGALEGRRSTYARSAPSPVISASRPMLNARSEG